MVIIYNYAWSTSHVYTFVEKKKNRRPSEKNIAYFAFKHGTFDLNKYKYLLLSLSDYSFSYYNNVSISIPLESMGLFLDPKDDEPVYRNNQFWSKRRKFIFLGSITLISMLLRFDGHKQLDHYVLMSS